MPTYEYRCRECDITFEVRRPMAEADAPAPCPEGHDRTARLLSAFAVSSGGGSTPQPPCGSACACAN